jgi:UDP-N-acetylmuramoyl-L-alanyl-D-glutamate--2,6-diaminopimelate ligase
LGERSAGIKRALPAMERMKMKLKKLLKEIDLPVVVKGMKDCEITGISADSKCVAPGHLFFAKKGRSSDGADFIPQAISSGAVAIATDLYNPFFEDVVQIVYSDLQLLEEKLAEHFYEHSTDSLFLVGITGTNGKTTTSFLVKHLLDRLKEPCGLIGTIQWIIGSHHLPSNFTTPDLFTNHKLFYEMRQEGLKAAVMEVSSHGLDQGRVRGIDFDAAIFTNLTLDHLDYHQTMEAYAEAKSKLFAQLRTSKKPYAKVAIGNADDPWMSKIMSNCSVPIMTYGINRPADVSISQLKLSEKGTECVVHYKDKSAAFFTSLIGRFNLYNCLAVFVLGISRGVSLETISHILGSFQNVPGRLEKISNTKGLHVFVDYAHTDDALKNVLKTLNEIKKGRLITVFGCGGNRDKSKRPKMAEVAEEFSDFTVVTSDNPRQEDPEAIIKEIITGFKRKECFSIEVDRRAAIHQAIQRAKSGDVILIAGKGHETYQIFSHQTIDFDDRLIAQEVLS